MIAAWRRHRADLIVFLIAALWFLPALWWGLPQQGSAVPRPWGPDELAPWYVQAFLEALRGGPNTMSPQYPLFHYYVLAALAWPYHVAVGLADNIGLPAQTASLPFLTLLERVPSLLMAAGAVALTGAATRRATGSQAGGLVAAAALATTGPLVFYARTSNVDAPSLFWVALAVWLTVAVLRDGLTTAGAVGWGVCAGLGTATKDQQYAVFVGLGVALLGAHLADARRTGARLAWGALAWGVAAGAVSYLATCGLILMPQWFRGHVQYITHGSNADQPEEIRRLAGFYGSNPATLAGYLAVLRQTGAQLFAALGAPILVLSAAGVVYCARKGRRLLWLLLAPLCLMAGVILPVRFVLPRFLMPVELVLCLFAGVATAAGLAAGKRWRWAVGVTAAVGLAWSAVRGLDLTYQMLRDTRYEAGRWLARSLAPGDTVGFYGARVKLPAMARGTAIVPAPFQIANRGADSVPATPAFILVVPQQMQEVTHEWVITDATLGRLVDGTLGYRQVLAIQTRGLFTRPLLVSSFVNPPVRIFAREDIVPRLREPLRRELPDPGAPATR